LIDVGCWVRMCSGIAGNTPANDTFPFFASTHVIYLRILWDLSPMDYRIVAFHRMPIDAYDPNEYIHAKQIMLSDITDVFLEVAPSMSMRIYLNNKQVIKLTPLPSHRHHAAAWVDAVYAGMQLQSLESAIQTRRSLLDNQLTSSSEVDEFRKMEEEKLVEEEEMISDLRLKYYELRPQEVNEYTFGSIENPDDHQDSNGIVTTINDAAGDIAVLGGNCGDTESGDTRSSGRPVSGTRSMRLSKDQMNAVQKSEEVGADGHHPAACCLTH
jgi:hypothetical protein